MLPKIDFSQTAAFQKLTKHFESIKGVHLRDLFKNDPTRFEKFSIHLNGLLFDYSKNRINDETIRLLIELAEECGLKQALEAQKSGEIINETEGRAVLHTALRDIRPEPTLLDGENIQEKIQGVLTKMRSFSDKVILGNWKGYAGDAIQTVVNIGIGGSDLGPMMVTEALKAYKNHLDVRYVSNIDASHIVETLKDINPATTLFIIVSKTFTTQETMTNAHTAKAWLLDALPPSVDPSSAIEKHFVAVSTNKEAVQAFGIHPNNMFEFWDWVGGRYSLWSSVGLSISLSLGHENFETLLAGAHEVDQHVANSPFDQNIPVIMALLGIWYNNFFESHTYAVLPYDQYLHRFPAYLQQLDMESNGKSVDRNGRPITYQTGPVIWGEPGTNGQHAFFQLLHQGTKIIPADFIAAANPIYEIGNHHALLISNFLAQTEALMNGKSLTEIQDEKAQKAANFQAGLGGNNTENQALEDKQTPYQVFEGNRPTNSILLEKLNPRQLGKLIALYEHKVFVQGVIWNIYSFDQFGVELGKKLAGKLQNELMNDHDPHKNHDAPTSGLIKYYKKWRSQS